MTIPKPTGTSLAKLKSRAGGGAEKPETLAIDKDVPMPGPRQRHSVIRNTLLEMTVGDSFFLKTASAGCCHAQAKKLGMKLVARREGEGFRVWRYQ